MPHFGKTKQARNINPDGVGSSVFFVHTLNYSALQSGPACQFSQLSIPYIYIHDKSGGYTVYIDYIPQPSYLLAGKNEDGKKKFPFGENIF